VSHFFLLLLDLCRLNYLDSRHRLLVFFGGPLLLCHCHGSIDDINSLILDRIYPKSDNHAALSSVYCVFLHAMTSAMSNSWEPRWEITMKFCSCVLCAVLCIALWPLNNPHHLFVCILPHKKLRGTMWPGCSSTEVRPLGNLWFQSSQDSHLSPQVAFSVITYCTNSQEESQVRIKPPIWSSNSVQF